MEEYSGYIGCFLCHVSSFSRWLQALLTASLLAAVAASPSVDKRTRDSLRQPCQMMLVLLVQSLAAISSRKRRCSLSARTLSPLRNLSSVIIGCIYYCIRPLPGSIRQSCPGRDCHFTHWVNAAVGIVLPRRPGCFSSASNPHPVLPPNWRISDGLDLHIKSILVPVLCQILIILNNLLLKYSRAVFLFQFSKRPRYRYYLIVAMQ